MDCLIVDAFSIKNVLRVIDETKVIRNVSAKESGSSSEESAPVGFIQAFMLPNVMNYAIAFGFFKLVSYLRIPFPFSCFKDNLLLFASNLLDTRLTMPCFFNYQ